MDYGTRTHWDRRHASSGPAIQSPWVDDWMQTLAPVFESIGARRILDVGCGNGRDLVRLREAGYDALGMDFSLVALDYAQAIVDTNCVVLADMAKGLPFRTSSFDAVVSNVAVHMFSDEVTRDVFAEIARVTDADGAVVLQVNSVDDRRIRGRTKQVVREMEPDFVLEDDGQTMHFFNREYAEELLQGWREVRIEPRELLTDDGTVFKKMLCCTAIGQR